MLLRRHVDHLAVEELQRGRDLAAGVARRDDRVDVTAGGRDVRVDEGVLVLLLQLEAQRVDVLTLLLGLLQAAACLLYTSDAADE